MQKKMTENSNWNTKKKGKKVNGWHTQFGGDS